MKSFSLVTRLALLSLALGAACTVTASAQDTPAAPSDSSPGVHQHDSMLSPDERAELKKDRDQVFAANPDLKSERDDLRSQRSSMGDASAGDKAAFHDKWHAYMEKMNAAIVKIDPNAAPLIAKMQAARAGDKN